MTSDESWDHISQWWVDAVRDDPTQSTDMIEVLDQMVDGTGGFTIDLGCGEGQVMRRIGGAVIGTDLSVDLLTHASSNAPVVCSRLPNLSWARADSFDRAIACGVIEMIEDHVALFGSAARVVRPGGHLLAVMNHPVTTAPRSEPLVDPEGEVLWKWGDYLTAAEWSQHADGHDIQLFHRPLDVLLTDAATEGWALDLMIERGPSEETLARFPEFHGQRDIPSLIGLRWSRRA